MTPTIEEIVRAEQPDFVQSLQGFASFCESIGRGHADLRDDMNMLAGKLRDACFVIDQLQKLRDEQRALLSRLSESQGVDHPDDIAATPSAPASTKLGQTDDSDFSAEAAYREGFLDGIRLAAEIANGVEPSLLDGMSERYISIYCTARRDAADAIKAAAPSAPAIAVPEGWQLVPKEPTEAMRIAGYGEITSAVELDDRDLPEAYRAMLAAAPSAPASVEWQPIETAPADVDLLLGWWTTWPKKIWNQKVDLARCTRGGWRDGHATHWQPCPTPPKEQGDEG